MKPVYEADFLSKALADSLYTNLMTIGWVQRDNTPRQEYWDTLLRKPYTYGRGRGERTYEPNPNLMEVHYVRLKVQNEHNAYLKGCFLNRYDTGTDALGWHADDDPGINHMLPIAVVSLGAERAIQWKVVGTKGQEAIQEQVLGHGSLFLMPAGMQFTHVHRIPKQPQLTEPRISMTYRGLME